MLNIIVWLLAAQAIGLAVFPLTYYLFPRFKDRGFSLAMPVGIILVAYLSWLLSVLHIVPSIQLSVLGILLMISVLSGWFVWYHRQEMMEFVVRERTAYRNGSGVPTGFLGLGGLSRIRSLHQQHRATDGLRVS